MFVSRENDSDRRVALATMHGKEDQIGPELKAILGWCVEVADIDTDQLGTFTGDIPRQLSPRDTAIRKAYLGAEKLGLAKGMGSEGTIGPHPSVPFLTVNRELIGFVDREHGIELVESSVSGDIWAFSEVWKSSTNVRELAERSGLPTHGLIVRTTESENPLIRKGITNVAELERAIKDCRSREGASDIVIESDFRAMMSPTRQATIRACATKIAKRLRRECDRCKAPGWGDVDVEYGVSCQLCGELSFEHVSASIEGCVRCDYRQRVSRPDSFIDPSHCSFCNP